MEVLLDRQDEGNNTCNGIDIAFSGPNAGRMGRL